MVFEAGDQRLDKIVALAKFGVGGEKENALKLVKKICREKGISFDDVMEKTDFVDYSYRFRKTESDIVAQIIFKFATTIEHPSIRQHNFYSYYYYTTTPAKQIETLHALDVYLKAFRKEKKKVIKDLPNAFIIKHSLYSDVPSEEKENKPMTREDREALRRSMVLAENLDDVEFQKQIEAGKKKTP